MAQLEIMNQKYLGQKKILDSESVRRSYLSLYVYTPSKTKMTIGKQPFEDVSSNKNGHFPIVKLLFGGVSIV